MNLSKKTIDYLFEYQTPTDDHIQRMKDLRVDAKALARTINNVVPDCADKSAAIRLLRQCVQISNAAIVLDGVV